LDPRGIRGGLVIVGVAALAGWRLNGQSWHVHRKLKRAASVRGHAEPPALVHRLLQDAPSGRKALCGTEGASRAEWATASSWPLIAVIEGDGRLKVWLLHFVTGLQRPNYQDPPGSRVLLGGSWPSRAPVPGAFQRLRVLVSVRT
jgi:hypothetical protein